MTDENNTGIINEMIAQITAKRETRGVKMRGGKTYTMVQDRIETLRRMSGDYYRINTEMLQYTTEEGGSIVMRTVIRTPDGQTVATGHAEEIRGSSQITDTSAIEVCETSSVGRALAMLGIHGGEFASAEELQVVVDKLDKRQTVKSKPAPKSSALVHQEPEPSQLALDVDKVEGKPNGVHNAKIMQDVREDVAAMVATIHDNTPILKPSSDNAMIAECFFTFMPLCNSVQETYSFWFSNENILNTLKQNDAELYDQVKLRFMARRDELKQKDTAR